MWYLCAVARIMGIDYGTKRVGIAVTDPLQIIATGLTTVATEEAFSFIRQYFEEEEVECIVVGEPLHLDGSPSQITPQLQLFIAQLKKQFPTIAVETQDERFTSEEAKQIILKSGVNKKKRRDKSLIDKISAVLILQDFLEKR